ncbi:MAG: transglutaminase domain-containing protein [Lachnospiraceae bacterium]|nr:transglutaminase domain-containing protein [Lachnospiraceae bacterium]
MRKKMDMGRRMAVLTLSAVMAASLPMTAMAGTTDRIEAQFETYGVDLPAEADTSTSDFEGLPVGDAAENLVGDEESATGAGELTDADTVSGNEAVESQAMYRMYNPNSGEHFYTASRGEAKSIRSRGWLYEGIGWYAPRLSSRPVYRLYNPNAGDHHYTLNNGERKELVALGWRDEGIGWYSDPDKTTAIYREYNPNAKAGAHNFTAFKNEDNSLGKAGWSQEGIAWYAVRSGQAAAVRDLGATTIYKGTDLSAIYDYEYYISKYSDAAALVGGDGQKVIENFVTVGLKEGRAGKATYDEDVYKKFKEQYHPSYRFPKAKAKLDQIGWTLRKAFNWSAGMKYYGHNSIMPDTPDPGIKWYADYGFDNHKGNCYVMAATFYEMAVTLGYEARQCWGVVPLRRGGLGPHSWVEVNLNSGTDKAASWAVFDPDFTEETGRNGYNIYYGQSGTWRYTRKGFMKE